MGMLFPWVSVAVTTLRGLYKGEGSITTMGSEDIPPWDQRTLCGFLCGALYSLSGVCHVSRSMLWKGPFSPSVTLLIVF